MTELSPESQARCDIALGYVQQMIAFYDEDLEDDPKIVFAHRVLDQVDKRTPLTPEERTWLEDKIRAEC
jgi:hypothetical protein